MMNDDNLESNLLTSSLLKMLVQVVLEIPSELEICYCVDPDPKWLHDWRVNAIYMNRVKLIIQWEWILLAITVYMEV